MGKSYKNKVDLTLPIGQVLRQLRELSRYKQSDIAKIVNTSRNHICQIENGVCYPSYELLQRILFELGYQVTVKKRKKIPLTRRKKSVSTAIEALQNSTPAMPDATPTGSPATSV